MVFLPRCLYLVQNTMLQLYPSFFRKLDSLLISLVCAGYCSGVALLVLKHHMEDGGLAIPAILHYYYAASLQNAARWLAELDNWEKRLFHDILGDDTLARLLM